MVIIPPPARHNSAHLCNPLVLSRQTDAVRHSALGNVRRLLHNLLVGLKRQERRNDDYHLYSSRRMILLTMHYPYHIKRALCINYIIFILESIKSIQILDSTKLCTYATKTDLCVPGSTNLCVVRQALMY